MNSRNCEVHVKSQSGSCMVRKNCQFSADFKRSKLLLALISAQKLCGGSFTEWVSIDEQWRVSLRSPMAGVGWCSVKHTTTGLWSSGKLFCGVTNHTSLLGPVLPVKGNLNASAYQEMLDNTLLPMLWEQFGEGPFLFQHDCAPVHNARFMKTWLDEFGV